MTRKDVTGIVACFLALFATAFLLVPKSSATVFGVVRGIVHDPQHHPVNQAQVTLQASDSGLKLSAATNADGEFQFDAGAAREIYRQRRSPGLRGAIAISAAYLGFPPILHYQLALAATKQEVTVTAAPADLNPDSPRRDILIDQEEISYYAGLDSANSFKIITAFVPGSYMVHDQLHVRGGHQVTWALDGVSIPNTNIASNVGPQFNPKDISYLQAETGSYAIPAATCFAGSLEDQFKATKWLIFIGGLRLTHFPWGVTENAADPRIGVAIACRNSTGC